jgi:hypothetical protein
VIRRQDRAQDADRRRFASAVRTQQTEDFTFLDGEGNVVDGVMSVEALVQIPGNKKWLSHKLSSLSTASYNRQCVKEISGLLILRAQILMK